MAPKHFYFDITLQAIAETAEEAWEIALEEFISAKMPCPEASTINEPPVKQNG